MSILEFVTKIVSALAWPAAVVTAVWFLRRAIPGLLDRVKRAEFPGGSVDFERAEANLETAAANARPVPALDEDAIARAVMSALPPTSRGGTEIRGGPDYETKDLNPAGSGREGPIVGRIVAALATAERQAAAGVEAERRREIEAIISAAAEWGYASAKTFDRPLKPTIRWSDTGRPSIHYGETDRS